MIYSTEDKVSNTVGCIIKCKNLPNMNNVISKDAKRKMVGDTGISQSVGVNNKHVKRNKKYRNYVVITSLILVFYIWIYHSMSIMYFKSVQIFNEKKENMSYILIWTSPKTLPFRYLSKGVHKFKGDLCVKQNCFITSDKSYFPDLTMFDVLLFHGPELVTNRSLKYPDMRSSAQQYIFASQESSEYYPLCDKYFDNYFNRTWTYQLNSDIFYGYITIRDKNWNIIGPKENMQWINVEEMKSTNLGELIIGKLKAKRKAAVWFVSNCKPRSKRNLIANSLGKELQKYGLVLDVYGGCGKLKCSVNISSECDKKVQEDYYFYLSLENSKAKDYVTEKLLRPLKNYAIPVVYGGANYSRFLPDGSYLDANKHNTSELAKQMHELINNRSKYYEYFKWHNYYTYHDPDEYPDSNNYCSFCEVVSDERLKVTKHSYHGFRNWWNKPGNCKS